MKQSNFDRRKFIKYTAATATGMGLFSIIPEKVLATPIVETKESSDAISGHADPRIKFGVIGINHSHIYAQVDAVVRGGGQFVSFYAKEPELVAAFSRRYPQVKLA